MSNSPKHIEFSDPRLVPIYDTVNPIEEYRDFYLNLAANLKAARIIDLGCGTGLLTRELAKHGHQMIGIEPSALMLDVARRQPTAQPITWRQGSTDQLGPDKADLAIMTGHVAQFFLSDTDWNTHLTALHRALKPGGYLAFESRNPQTQPFTTWPTSEAHSILQDPQVGHIEWWAQNIEFFGDRATYEIHYYIKSSGDEIVSHNELVFRSQEQLSDSLKAAGFVVEQVYGNWDKSLLTESSPEMIFIAHRP
jgi:ubiquinone/menaquinone biosynthesis C-methylase UbiE